MLRWSGRIVSGLLLIIGLVWVLQGLDFLSGSYMSGDIFWTAAGLLLILFALVLLLVSRILIR